MIEEEIRQAQTDCEPMQALRRVALRYPEAEEGIACKGTALECSTFKARNKTFLFVIDESYRLLVHKELVAMLPDSALPTVASTATTRKKTPKKKTPKKKGTSR